MTPIEFKYWLQGFFELSSAAGNNPGSGTPLTPQQVRVIRNHLAMALTTEPATNDPYCRWLEGFLESQSDTPAPSLTLNQTRRIAEKLHNEFQHVVAQPAGPSFETVAQPGGLMRC